MKQRAQAKTNPPPRWIPLLLVGLGILAYFNCFNGVFVFDDHDSVVRNPHIRQIDSLADLMSTPPQTTLSGRPVLVLSFALNQALLGNNPWGYHLGNLLVHLLAGLTLYGIVRRTLILRQPAATQTSALLAAAVAGLWIVHPLHTSAVTYIAQRAESLMGLLYLLTLYCFIRGLQGRPLWYALSVASAAVAMGCKEAAASVPLLVLLYDWIFVGGTLPQALRRRSGVYAGLFATWIIVAAIALSGIRTESVGFGFGITALDYLRTQAGVLAWYLRLCFWPTPLVLSYNWPIARSLADVWPAGLLILALLAATAFALHRRSWLAFAGAWFFLILAPSSSILPIATEIAAEHRMYLPLAAVIAVVVCGICTLLPDIPRTRRLLTGVVSLLIAALTVMTLQRNALYASELSIWSDNVASQPNDYRAHYNLGQALEKSGDRAAAMTAYQLSLKIEPNYSDAHYKLALNYESLGSVDPAIHHYLRAVACDPALFEAHYRVAFLLAQRENWSDAIRHFQSAVQLRPDHAEAHWYLGLALRNAGRPAQAAPHLQRAIQLNPSLAQGINR